MRSLASAHLAVSDRDRNERAGKMQHRSERDLGAKGSAKKRFAVSRAQLGGKSIVRHPVRDDARAQCASEWRFGDGISVEFVSFLVCRSTPLFSRHGVVA